MRVAEVLSLKSDLLVEIAETESMLRASELILTAHVGMLLVKDSAGRLIGTLSERDLICHIARNGEAAVRDRVSDALTSLELTASATDPVNDIMRIMTQKRVRHLPVLDDGRLVGVISIGDILKSRIAEKDQETAILRDMARASLAFGA